MHTKFCIICLRTDRQVKVTNKVHDEFLDELCAFNLPTQDNYYCYECEHRLNKFYKFQIQFKKALKLLKTWKSTKSSTKQPLSDLHKLLSPPTVSNWTPSSKIANFNFKDELDPISIENYMHPVSATNVIDLPEVVQILANSSTEDICEDEIKLEIDELTCSPMDVNDLIQNADIPQEPVNNDDVKKTNDVLVDIEKDMVKSETNSMTEDYLDEDMLNDDYLATLACVESSNDDTDSLSDDNDDCNKKKDGTKRKRLLRVHVPFDVAKLKADLLLKFSLCGDIIAKDGKPMDKDLILRSIERKVLYHDLRSLRNILRKTPIKAVSEKLKDLLNNIHDRFKENQKFEAVFDIQYLPTYDSRLEEFEKRKTYECYNIAEYKCDICYQPFRSEKYYKGHMTTYHNDSPDGKFCPICKMRVNLFKRNAHTHAAVFKCKMCPLVTYYRNTMKQHYGTHTGKIYRCEPCDATYKGQSGYFLHISRYHRSGRHVCTKCGRGFSTTQGLTTHSHIHKKDLPTPELGNEEGVECKECDVTFPSQLVYDAHLADVHAPPPEVKFVQIPRDSYNLPAYHNRVVQRKKTNSPRKVPSIKCRLCNESRLGHWWLTTHFKREHPDEDFNMVYADMKKHLCDVCGVGFATVYGLRDHMNIHTGALPFECDLCLKKFRTKLLMSEHRNRHFPAKILCTLCGKKFKTKSNLFVHMQGHVGEKRHKCEICGKGFRFSGTLKEHVNGVHYNIRRVRKRTHTGARKDAEREDMEEEGSE